MKLFFLSTALLTIACAEVMADVEIWSAESDWIKAIPPNVRIDPESSTKIEYVVVLIYRPLELIRIAKTTVHLDELYKKAGDSKYGFLSEGREYLLRETNKDKWFSFYIENWPTRRQYHIAPCLTAFDNICTLEKEQLIGSDEGFMKFFDTSTTPSE